MNPAQIQAFLKGKKTYLAVLISLLYLAGVWAGCWGFDEKVLAALGLSALAFLGAKINRFTGGIGPGANVFVCSALAAVLLLGCKTPSTLIVTADDDHNIGGSLTTQPSTNLTIGIEGTGNPDTGEWEIGIVVTFKDAPTANVADYLLAAGFSRVNTRDGSVEFVLPGKVDSELKRQAMQVALENGAAYRMFRTAAVARAARSGTEPFTLALRDAAGQPFTLTLSRPAPPPPDPFPLNARGLAAKTAVLAEVTRLVSQDSDAVRGYCVTYYTCALVGLSTGSLTHQQILLAQQNKRVSAYLQSYVSAAPQAELTQVCLGLAAAGDQALRAAGKPGVVN